MIYFFENYELNDRRRVLTRGGEAVPLQRLPFDVFVYLIRHRDRVVPTDELLSVLWAGRRISATSLPRCIHAIRQALNDPSRVGGWIETAHGSGYRFGRELADVRSEGADVAKEAPDGGPENFTAALRKAKELVEAAEFEQARPILLRASIVARHRGDHVGFAEAAIAFSESFTFVLPIEISREFLEEAVKMPGVAPGMRARVEARLALAMVGFGDTVARDAYAKSALARSAALPGAERMRVLLDICRAFEGMGADDLRTPLIREIRTLRDEYCDETTELEVRLAEVKSLLRPETFQCFVAELSDYAEIVRTAPPQLRILPYCGQASVAALRGHFSEATARLDDAIELASSSREDAVLLDGNRWHIERRRESVPTAIAGLRFPFDVPDSIRPQMVLLLCDIGALDLARDHLELLKKDGLPSLSRDLSLGMNLAALAEASTTLGDRETAQLVYDAFLPYEEEIVSASIGMILDPVSYFLGLTASTLGRAERAAEHFRDSVLAAEQMEARTTLARTHYAWGLASPDWREARNHLEKARECAGSIDLKNLADDADRLLRERASSSAS